MKIRFWQYHKLYSDETGSTKILMAVGVFASFFGGFIFPAFGIILGELA